ncbi:MAG: hypothetical protein B7Z74_03905 [Deltaproteobacteria bacterium 21-66-5]|nr:MAG: hypothetical protein B7Z74_03905 [Deltaproteobacteria bacterium 21-66-5]
MGVSRDGGGGAQVEPGGVGERNQQRGGGSGGGSCIWGDGIRWIEVSLFGGESLFGLVADPRQRRAAAGGDAGGKSALDERRRT